MGTGVCRRAPHLTSPSPGEVSAYVVDTVDGEEGEMGCAALRFDAKDMLGVCTSVKRAGDGKNVGRAGMRIGWDWRQSLTRRCVR